MTSEHITLYFKQGGSDKVYNASLEEVKDNRFVVNFAYGRRGATLTTGTKTNTPLDYDSAKKIYAKLVKSKTSKGYVPGAEGPQYVHTDADTRDTGVQCQLLNFIEEAEAERLIKAPDWWAQEKYDGKRMLLRKTETVTAINRQGLSVDAPDAIITSAGSIDQSYLVDGEAVGDTLFVFDLLAIDGTDLRSAPYGQRLAQLEILGFGEAVVVAETAKTPREKQQFYDRLRASGAEGIVFKQHVAPYTTGRPNSGGTQVKFKFYATASVVVTQINAKRSVAVAVLDGEQSIEIGNVTIPPNKDIPAVNAIIEVRYLYAYPGGSLYQPTYLGPRDDLHVQDCVIAQLKYKS
ncbi:ATP-dependent DNA ligase [Candidatus Vecturithrix granuli]|uniref:ATP-dependent DNA ligase n=1 Tax=Vecturithrix granuli TaxID=1499967 RepID=A0A081BV47_VECG1|nr:ATP-dependent DNA ligase [Candidatus Vecturithrix granuli]